MTVRIQERVATDSTDVLTNSVSSKSCSCCFVAQASKPEPKLPVGDFHGGVGRRRVLWSVCPSPPLAERVPVVLTTHACETESHAALPLYHLPPWSTLSNTYGFSGYMGARHLAACAMIRSIRSLFFPFSLRTSSHAFQLH